VTHGSSGKLAAAVVPLPVAPARIAGRLAHSGEELRIVQSVPEARSNSVDGRSGMVDSSALPAAAGEAAILLEAVADGLEELRAMRTAALHELQSLAVLLAVRVARTILQHEFSLTSERVMLLAEQAVAQLDSDAVPLIFVHPADLQRLEQMETRHDGLLATARWRADSGLAPGDVRIEGGNYGLESRVAEQLDAITNTLLESLADAATERRRAAGDGQSFGRFPDRRHCP
jgi:Flagellar assembly protein FliH